MTRAFLRLCGMELRLFLARPLTWLVFGGLFGAMLIGADTGAERRSAQERTIEHLLAQEDRSRQVTRDMAKRYSASSILALENHRDPTDAFGYMNYYLVSHAYKIPTPLAALAVGQSDLRPYYERVDFTSVLSDGAYEPENPRTLSVGSFDLAFVLIYLVPLAVIALIGTRLSGELDSGVLRLIASHPMPPRQVAVAKFGGPALATAALIVALTLASLVTAGDMHVDSTVLPAIALVAFAIAGYTLMWCAGAAAVATLWQGVARSVLILVGAWLLTSLVVPFAAAMIISMAAPPPSRAAYIDASREAMDAFFANEPAVYASYVAARADLREASPSLVSSSALKRFARDEAYKAPLRRWEERFDGHARRVDALASWLRILSPALALDGVLQRAAETDIAAYRRFAQHSREHTKQLRQFFEPLALANAVNGEKRSCDTCPGRMNFTAYDRVPTFVPDSPATALSIGALANALLSWIAAAALALVAARRLNEWPA